MRAWIALVLVGCGYNPSPATSDGAPTNGDGSVTGDGTAIDMPMNVPALENRGLELRYFIDEATSGTAVANLTDSATNPLPLPMTFGQATFTEDGGHRGLHWAASASAGVGKKAFSGTKLDDFGSSDTVTIEVVAKITGATTGFKTESQVAGLRGGNPDFVLAAAGEADFVFYSQFSQRSATWAGANNQERMVIHLVYDASQGNGEDRVNLFRNGVAIAKTANVAPTQFQPVGLGGSDSLVIGNNPGGGGQSIEGTIFYVAFYNVALNDQEIATNAQHLLVDDDDL